VIDAVWEDSLSAAECGRAWRRGADLTLAEIVERR
jgi:hypothetical protein